MMENSAAFIPPEHRTVLIEWLSGKHFTEIAQSRGLSKQRVEQIVARYVPEKALHRMRSYPYYSVLQDTIRKSFSSVRAFALAAGLAPATLSKALQRGTNFRMDTAELIYTTLAPKLSYSELFQKSKEEK